VSLSHYHLESLDVGHQVVSLISIYNGIRVVCESAHSVKSAHYLQMLLFFLEPCISAFSIEPSMVSPMPLSPRFLSQPQLLFSTRKHHSRLDLCRWALALAIIAVSIKLASAIIYCTVPQSQHSSCLPEQWFSPWLQRPHAWWRPLPFRFPFPW